jgi:hypothetical protein
MHTKPPASFVPHSSPGADGHAMATQQTQCQLMHVVQWADLYLIAAKFPSIAAPSKRGFS